VTWCLGESLRTPSVDVRSNVSSQKRRVVLSSSVLIAM